MFRLFFLFSFSLISIHISAQEYYPQAINLDVVNYFGYAIFEGGGGISCSDFNGDGYDDLTFATDDGRPILFYENKIDHFELVTPPFITNTLENKQVLWIDYDNDGDKDFYTTAYNGANRLYENDGNMVFTDVSVSSGLTLINDETYGANFGDLDRDGDLDLYLCNYGHQSGASNLMYEFDLATKTYTDVTSSSGTGNGMRQSFCSAFFDFDDDGDLDIYVANDRVLYGNTLYMNVGGMSFIDVSVPSHTDTSIFAMNTGIGDPDLDGDFDIYVTNIGASVFYENNGDMTYTDVALDNGTSFDRTGWGGNFLDWNNDRYEDLYVSYATPLGQNPVNAFYVNNQDGTFSEPFYNTKGLASIDTVPSFCNAIGDFNNDGLIDIVSSRSGENNFELFINHENTINNFIKLELKGSTSNKFGIGSKIEVVADGVSSFIYKHSSIAYLAQNSDYINVGLGTANSVDQIKIYWSNGNIETIAGADLLVNGINTIREGFGVVTQKVMPVCDAFHSIQLDPIPSQIYGANTSLISNTLVKSNANVHFQSEQEIQLNEGFEVNQGAEFFAEINGCGN